LDCFSNNKVEPYLDLSQGFKLTFGIFAGDAGIYINILPIFFLGFLKIIEASNLVGRKITILEFRETELGDIFPYTGTIKKRLDIGKEKNYLLVKLDVNFQYENKTISHILTKAKDQDQTLTLRKKNQLAFFRIVLSENDLMDSSIEKFLFIDWVKIY